MRFWIIGAWPVGFARPGDADQKFVDSADSGATVRYDARKWRQL